MKKRWILIWELSMNTYSQLEYRAEDIPAVIEAWKKTHKRHDVSAIVKVELHELFS